MTSEAVIGLEVHIQLATRTKIFCPCPVNFGSIPNTQTCAVCLGLPGTLPVLNRHAVELAIITACATGCRILPVSRFARKQYFYPDLPKGYQITQYDMPFAVDGFLDIELGSNANKRIGITRMHLEEDAGRLLHAGSALTDESSTIDYNRAGLPLIEVVSEPDMRTPEEASAYLRELHMLVRYLGVCNGNMEQGNFRCDANVSIRPEGSTQPGAKVELKNLNSFRYLERALYYEIQRQADVVNDGNSVASETRLWDDMLGKSVCMRGKEDASDYRYFPEPDLAPLTVDTTWIAQLTAQMPELPRVKKDRFIDQYGLSRYNAEFLTRNLHTADYFEQTVACGADPQQVCNWITGEVNRRLDDMQEILSFAVTPEYLAELIHLTDTGILNSSTAKAVFEGITATGLNPIYIVEQKNLEQITETALLDRIVSGVLGQYPDEVYKYRNGRKKLLTFFIGQVMQQTGGRADPELVNQILRNKLDE